MRPASRPDDRANSPREESSHLAYSTVWGPVPDRTATCYGALAGCESIVVRPIDARGELEDLMRRVRALIPTSLIPRYGDDAQSLVSRLTTSEFLDDIHVLEGGSGPRRVRLNATRYAQPRRVTWSEEAKPAGLSPSDARWLYAYTQYGRLPSDWRCRLMPPAVKELRSFLWRVAKATGKLTQACMSWEPTACQLMMYYALFGSCVGRHRDNFCHEHVLQYLSGADVLAEMTSGHSASSDTNSQVVGSDVLIWTDGNAPMTLRLSFPDRRDRTCNRRSYVIHPAFCIRLGKGTLLIFKAMDDLLFCHEAAFEAITLEYARWWRGA